MRWRISTPPGADRVVRDLTESGTFFRCPRAHPERTLEVSARRHLMWYLSVEGGCGYLSRQGNLSMWRVGLALFAQVGDDRLQGLDEFVRVDTISAREA